MKEFIAADIGGVGEPTKIVCANAHKGKTIIRKTLTLDNAGADFTDKTEQAKVNILNIKNSKAGFKNPKILLILPENEYKPLLFKTERALKSRYIKRWTKTTLLSKNKSFYYDSVNPAKIVSCDIFGNAADTTCGALISTDMEAVEDIYKDFEAGKLTNISVISAMSAASMLGKSLIPKSGCRAVLDLGLSSFSLNIYLNKVLVSSQTDNYAGAEIIRQIMRYLNVDIATVGQMLRDDGFLNAEETASATIEQKEFATVLSSVFAEAAAPISNRLNAARGKQYYPSKIYVTGGLSYIKGIADAIGGILNVSSEVVSLERGQCFGAVVNETENTISAGAIPASMTIGGYISAGYADAFALKSNTAIIKPQWLKIRNTLKTTLLLYIQVLAVILIFSAGNYALSRLKYERLAADMPESSEAASVATLKSGLSEKNDILNKLTVCTDGLPVKELLSVISENERSGLTIEAATTAFTTISDENAVNNMEENADNDVSGNLAVITLLGTAKTSGAVSSFIDELAKIPSLKNYTINNIEESLTEAGTRQLFEVALLFKE